MPLTTSLGSTTVQQTFLGKIILDECTHLNLFVNDGFIVTLKQNKYGHSTSNLFPSDFGTLYIWKAGVAMRYCCPQAES